jgi:hypothetical protein
MRSFTAVAIYCVIAGMIDLNAKEDWLAQANIDKVIQHPGYR